MNIIFLIVVYFGSVRTQFDPFSDILLKAIPDGSNVRNIREFSIINVLKIRKSFNYFENCSQKLLQRLLKCRLITILC